MANIFPVIGSRHLAASSTFYRRLFDLQAVFEAQWYIQLQAPDAPHFELGLVQWDHDSVPAAYRQRAQGVLITVEVDLVDPLYERAQAQGVSPVLTLRDEPWGQRHFICADPDGVLVDVVQMIEPAPEFAGAPQ